MPTAARESEFGASVALLWKGTIARLSREAGLDYDLTRRIVREGQEPTLAQAIAIAEVLNVSVEGLNGGKPVTE